jgi:DNA-binding MarR family transcriptional regulator
MAAKNSEHRPESGRHASPQTTAQATPRSHRLRTIAGYFAEPASGDTDRLIYERVRLGIMSALSVNPSMTFAALKELLQTSDGNLSRHARKLEDAGYVACQKTFAARVPQSRYSLTTEGRRAFARHLEHMDALIKAARGE